MPSEKGNVQAHYDNQDRSSTTAPRDLPPSYENTLIPITNTSVPSTPSQPRPQSTPSQNPLTALSRLSSVPFSQYVLRDAKLSDDQVSLTTSKPELLSTQYALAKFIREQAALPPKPVMVIKGTHASNSGPVLDFEIKCNLTSLLDIDSSLGNGGRMRVMAFQPSTASSQGSGSGSSPASKRRGNARALAEEASNNSNPLDAWIRKFTSSSSSEDSKSENRTFTLTRVAPNLPRGILEGHVRTLIAASKYRGKVTVEFPILYRDVSVEKQVGNWFTNLLRMTTSRKFEVVEAVWSVGGGGGGEVVVQEEALFAGEGSSGEGASNGDGESDRNGRAGLVAQEWWKEWQVALWNAVLCKRKGWVTVEDWLEAKMGLKHIEKGRDWGVDFE